MINKYGIKVAKSGLSAQTNYLQNLDFDSNNATYMVVNNFVGVVIANPQIFKHSLGYIPKVIIYKIFVNYNRKLPFDDGSGMIDFSVTNATITIRGATSGTFSIFIFTQEIL